MHKKLDIAIVSVGFISGRLRLDNRIFEEASEVDGIGDICFRFFDKNGKKVDMESDDRIIGISLEDFKNIKQKICVSGGLEKLEAIRGMLKGGLVDILITDSISF
jgi:deoxyribonucleoside regulator